MENIIVTAKVDTGNSANALLAMDKSIDTLTESTVQLSKATQGLSENTKSYLKEQRALAESTRVITQGAKDFLKQQVEIAKQDPAKHFAILNREVEKGNMSFAQTNSAIKQYRDIAARAGAESPIGKEAIKRSGDLASSLQNLQKEINATSNSGKNIQAALQLSSTLISGYTAFKGVLSMVGVEQEETLELIGKLQAAT